MTAVVFVGPTLTPEKVTDCLDATILPPVQQGDVYRVARDKPSAIGIIDGFFEGVPSVWHKEILWAMEQGIPVFGSASMGALRAAELADFGMIGVGRIYEDYRDGILQDDDEVAVLHSPAELGFRPLSEPMVSIRATIEQAQHQGVLTPEAATEMVRHAKAMNYRKRAWPAIIDATGVLPGVAEFSEWLPEGRIDAKAADARAMLVEMSNHLKGPLWDNSETVRTEQTLVWKALCARVDGADLTADTAIVDEVRLNPKLYAQLRDRTLLTLLSRDEASRQDRQPERSDLVKQMTAHRAETGLSRQSDLLDWIETNDLSPDGYEAMLADAARVDAAVAARAGTLDATLLSELRRTDRYVELKDRAARKAQQVTPGGKASADRLRVLVWYFETHLDQTVPDDLESYAASLGLPGRDAFYDLIEAEFLYCHRDTAQNDRTA